MTQTYVYGDGFSLNHGAVRKTPYRWLDLERLCKLLLPAHDVQRVAYYTAEVRARIGAPDQPIRQRTSLRAPGTLRTVRVHSGYDLSHPVWMPLVSPPPDGPRCAQVIETEDKSSDVTRATHLMSDAHDDAFDCAVLIPNESDLHKPVELVCKRLGKRVGVLNPP